MLLSATRVLVVAAHPDDETLGCGGTMARLSAGGAEIDIVFFTNGVDARGSDEVLDASGRRRGAALQAMVALGAREPTFLDFPDNRLDTVSMLDLAVAVEQQIAQSRPSLILTHNANDLNVDHRQVHEAVMTAARPQPGHQSPDVLCFEVPSSTEWRAQTAGNAFVPQVFVDISEYLDSKIEALRFYADELRPWPHARSIRGIEHLAGRRGASSGVEAAEAFMVARARW